jgi:hypothetical protein
VRRCRHSGPAERSAKRRSSAGSCPGPFGIPRASRTNASVPIASRPSRAAAQRANSLSPRVKAQQLACLWQGLAGNDNPSPGSLPPRNRSVHKTRGAPPERTEEERLRRLVACLLGRAIDRKPPPQLHGHYRICKVASVVSCAAGCGKMPKKKTRDCTQFAALPCRVAEDGSRQVMLLTSRETRRWVIPNGWPRRA